MSGGYEYAAAGLLLRTLLDAGGGPVLTGDLPISGHELQEAAQVLRERGIPVFATRARQDSAWTLAPIGDPIYEQTLDRYVTDCYTALVRSAQACARNPEAQRRRRAFIQAATIVGTMLNDERDVRADVTPEEIPEVLLEVLRQGGYIA